MSTTYTNYHNLPEAIVRAVQADPYHKGDAEFSITELLKPARQMALQIKHADEIAEDVSDRLWSLYGQIAHTILERANGEDLAEKRFFVKIDGRVISGQIDTLSLDHGVLSDWKFTTSWGFMAGREPKPEWIAQLNMQAFLLEANGYKVSDLQIIGLLRDWQINEAKKNQDYPQSPIVKMQIGWWTREITMSFIKDRIAAHLKAMESLPLCTDEERWARPGGWAVMKPGGKRAVKIVSTKEEAQDIASQYPGGKVEERRGIAMRCENYCNVNKFCSQYKESING